MKSDELIIAGRTFQSRLFLGTGKFPSGTSLRYSIEKSGTEMVTVALRRVDLNKPDDDILTQIDRSRIQLLPNTSGARNAEEAVRISKAARAIGAGNWIKLEVTPDPKYLLPDPVETLKAAEILVRDGFIVLPYINADPILAKRLEEAGCATVMPLGSPIGSNGGLQTKMNLEIIIRESNVPVVVDAGIGKPSHACEAMEMGADAVLVNTAIAISRDPATLSEAFRFAVEAGRTAFLLSENIGLNAISAEASSPLTGFLNEESR